MWRSCAVSGEQFEISERDISFYKRMGVPLPTLSPEERNRRRIAYRNFDSLYRRTCSATGQAILSMYREETVFPVYSYDYWWSDAWEAKTYGREFDFSRSFFDQYKELCEVVPRFAITNINCENCIYSNFAFESKDCYLIFGCVRNRDCLYGHIVWNSENCIDGTYLYECKWCSHSIDLVGCYDVHFSSESTNCSESWFLHDCRNCQNCFGSTNLRNKQYYFFNQALSKEEYQQKIQEYFPLTWERAEEFTNYIEQQKAESCIYPPMFASQTEDCSGNHIYFSARAEHCFDVKKAEDCSYCFTGFDQINCYDISFGGGRNSVECLTLTDTEECMYSHLLSGCNDVAYSEFCFYSHDLFACNGLRKAEYCILNQQYSKDDYFALRKKIIKHMKKTGEWGEFFPIENSPFAYNEAIVQRYYPMTEQQIRDKGLSYLTEVEQAYSGELNLVPESIEQVDEEDVNQTFHCQKTAKAYKILKSEIAFCKRTGVPLPRLSPRQREIERINRREIRRVSRGNCSQCGVEIISAFSPQTQRNVHCEACYLESLVS